ncbi:MAG: hypothetical protein CL780_03370 [Chloroflexi bacterium]|nr:hypothetical protein [Chloroflexota bacterium]
MKIKKIAIMSPIADAIGEAATVPRLAKQLKKMGYQIDLINCRGEWDNIIKTHTDIEILDLGTRKIFPFIPTFRWLSSWTSYRVWSLFMSVSIIFRLPIYLKRHKPDVLIVRMLTGPTTFAHKIASTNTKLIISMGGLPKKSPIRSIIWKSLFSYASQLVAPTEGVALSASIISKIPHTKFKIIPNPVIDKKVMEKSLEIISHKWYKNNDLSIILAVGRLTRQKDFPTLINAFKKINNKNARLLILGEGEDRKNLEKLISDLDITTLVDMPGFEPNPYKYMKQSSVLVMSSKWEGPGHVIIEGQALGIPIISTDCPSGPRDTLLDGKAGILTTVGDVDQLTNHLKIALDDPLYFKKMTKLGLKSSHRFTDEHVGEKWKELIEIITKK